MRISLCIATYRRPDQLAALLCDIGRQELSPDEVVIVDNDVNASAREAVEQWRRSGVRMPVRYDVQPLKNISFTRNRTVELAREEWIAFIDDDERAPPDWLLQMSYVVLHWGADGVLGPVVPLVPSQAASWIRRGQFYEWSRMRTGARIPPNRLRFGNVLLRGSLLRNGPPPFDPAYGLTGGEDGDLLVKLARRGANIIWCDEAIVTEPVDPTRLSLKWLLHRSLRGGQDFARHVLAGRYGPPTPARCALFFLRTLMQLIAATVLASILWPFGRHRSAFWLLKATANFGKLSVLWGWQYREYAGTA